MAVLSFPTSHRRPNFPPFDIGRSRLSAWAFRKGRIMLQVLGRRGPVQCDGTSRRDFLKVGTLGASGLLLADLLKARAETAARGQATKNTSVVWLWLGGGPTHIETFDPTMSAPAEVRSTF